MTSSLYIHIPFCTSKCTYCSFNSHAGLEQLYERYVKALCSELRTGALTDGQSSLATIFLGGGTPSILSSHLLEHILSSCYACFTVLPGAEVSVEANPGTVNRAKLANLLQMGVNRLSIGVQSFSDSELKKIGRVHSAAQAVDAVKTAQELGFGNISIDLMYGLPGQSAKSWQTSLEIAVSLELQHLSLYQLTVEEQSPLGVLIQKEELSLPDEDTIEEMDQIIAEFTESAGFEQYEISNYACPGYQSKHNINYWKNNDYLAFGAGAVSYIHGKRMRRVEHPERYCSLLEDGKSVVIEEEFLGHHASFRETVIMGLRMNRGVSLRMLESRYGMSPGEYYGQSLQQLLLAGMLESHSGFLRLSNKGRVFANRIMAELV